MTMTPEDLYTIKHEVTELKSSVSSVLSAMGESALAIKENTGTMNEMLLELRERDVRDEYNKEKAEALTEKVCKLECHINDYILKHADDLKQVNENHKNKKAFTRTLTSTWAKILALVIVIALATGVEVDISRLMGK